MPSKLFCAIYTRKSTEEGLEQDFNSLDAQREACAAFIASQRHEGWEALPDVYDDGGFSGGNANRPALQRLMADIKVGKVNTIVVYKIDRLTRSLADFAKMVELFDAHNVTFVSVTQQFNTTTSMGRLTLNVLLSFAQFEREVTGERIRDKIAASKAKGIWMGGSPPLGYDAVDRKLIVNPVEAKLVRYIFERYLALQSANKLILELRWEGHRTKRWTSSTGHVKGGYYFGCGALYYLLSNRVYLGEIVHKKQSHPGNHEAIIDLELWEKVQELREKNRYQHRHRTRAKDRSLLMGKLVDVDGNRMVPTASNNKSKQYRYYESRPKLIARVSSINAVSKIPANEIETVMVEAIKDLLLSKTRLEEILGPLSLQQFTMARTIAEKIEEKEVQTGLRDVIEKIVVHTDKLVCTLCPVSLARWIGISPEEKPSFTFTIPVQLKRINGGRTMMVQPDGRRKMLNTKLVRAVAKGYMWNHMLVSGQATSLDNLAKLEKIDSRYIRKLVKLAWLAPDVVEAIVDGRESETIRLGDYLAASQLEWPEQRQKLM